MAIYLMAAQSHTPFGGPGARCVARRVPEGKTVRPPGLQANSVPATALDISLQRLVEVVRQSAARSLILAAAGWEQPITRSQADIQVVRYGRPPRRWSEHSRVGNPGARDSTLMTRSISPRLRCGGSIGERFDSMLSRKCWTREA